MTPLKEAALIKRLWVVALVICFQNFSPAFAEPTLTPEAEKSLRETVSNCVKIVKSSKAPQSVLSLYGPSADLFFKDFDAFYNSSSGKVESNALTVAMQPPRFAFNKCMSDKGWPLQ